MNKFKNYGFWTALSGAVVMFLKTLGDACGFSIPQETVSNLIMAIAEILVVLGIVVMPKNVDNSANEDKQSKQDKAENSEENLDEKQKEETTSSEKEEK